MADTPVSRRKASLRSAHAARPGSIKSVSIGEWPAADQIAWAIACRPAERLRRGGGACHMKAVTRQDLVRRYGSFLSHLQRSEGLDPAGPAAAAVTPERVERFIVDLESRVRSVTVHGCIYKLRRMAQLLAPGRDFTWLQEIEKDLALVMVPQSKFGRLVYSDVLVEAGMTLMAEADAATHLPPLARARQYRDGLMVALLASCPIRLKNFAALEIGRTFRQVKGSWWIVLAASMTKEGRADERPVPQYLTRWIDRYLNAHRPILARTNNAPPLLWLSSTYCHALSYARVQMAIIRATLATIGIEISPHLFRAAAASTAAIHAGSTPHLASALLHHSDPEVTEEHYNRASSLTAAQTYAALVKAFRRGD